MKPPRPASGRPAETAGAAFSVDGQRLGAHPLSPALYVVATPIGHLGDITLRALETLAAADLIACEDTRVTRILLDRYGISRRLVAYHDHNAERQRPMILAALAAGKAVALVSDAGTPLVSDPGFRLVNAAHAAGHAIVPVPGASAVLAALVASGLPSDTFLFAGFLPPKPAGRKKRLAELAAAPATLVFFESPQRLSASLADMAATLGGGRRCVVARELTKTFETMRRDSLAGLAGQLAGEPPPKGEIVVLVGPPEEKPPAAEDVDMLLVELLKTHPVGEAAAKVAAETGLPRRDLYRRALDLRKGSGGGAA